MKTRITLLPVKLIVFLLTWLFVQFASAQNKTVSIEGYWLGEDKQLLLQQGYFWMQNKQELPQYGMYSFNGDYITLGEGGSRQVFRVMKKKDHWLLFGDEVELRLKAGKYYASRNISPGKVRPVFKARKQNIALPIAARNELYQSHQTKF